MSRPKFRVSTSVLAPLAAILLAHYGSMAAQSAVFASTSANSTVKVFPSEPAGGTSAASAVAVEFHNAGITGAVSIAPAAAPSDFELVSGGTCAPGLTHAAGATCTALVRFHPSAPGTSRALLLVRDGSGKTLGATRLRGTGTGAFAAFTPGLVESLGLHAQSSQGFSALATDGGSKAYLAEAATGQLFRRDTRTGETGLITTVRPVDDPVIRLAAEDGTTLFLLQQSGTVSRVDPETGTQTQIDTSGVAGGTAAAISAIAVDQEGRLLLAEGTRLLRLDGTNWTTVANNSACADTTSACGDGDTADHAAFTAIRAIAVDTSGNIFLADTGASRIRRIDAVTGRVSTVAGTGTACTRGGCGSNGAATAANLGALSGLAADPLGNIYITEQGTGARRLDLITGNIEPVMPSTETRFRSGTVQLAPLRDGSILLLAEADGSTLARFNPGAAALAFAQTAVGQTSTDSVQTVLLSNLGNAPLTMAAPSAGTNPSTTSDFPLGGAQTCPQLSSTSNSHALAPGDHCSIQVKFTPTAAGTVSGQVVLTESSATAAPVAHSIAVQGAATAAGAAASVALTSFPVSLVYGQPVTLFATVYSASNSGPTPTGTVTFTDGSAVIAADAPLSNGVVATTVTLPSTGSHTYAAAYSGDSNYAAATQTATAAVSVARSASLFTINFGTYIPVGQDLNLGFALSGQYAGTGIALPSGSVTYALLDSTGTVVVSGTAKHANRVNSVDENAALGSTLQVGTYTLRLTYPGDANFLPVQTEYQLVISRRMQSIDFAAIASPIDYGTPPIPLAATATSGLPVAFSVLSGPATVVNGQLVVTGLGSIVVAADQAGDAENSPAPRVTQTVLSVRPVAKLVWNTPSPIVVGTPLGGNQLNAVALDPSGQRLAGTYTYTPAAGTVLPAGQSKLDVSYVPNDTEHYGNVTLTASVVLTVRDLTTPVISFTGGTVPFGTSLSPVLNAAATYNNAPVAGTFTYTTAGATLNGTTSLPAGSYAVVATFVPADPNTYRGGSTTATVTVTRVAAAMSLLSSASPVLLQSRLTFTAKVSGGGGVPTGNVQFASGSTVLGSAAVDGNGTATLNFSTLPAGSQTITAIYSGDANYIGSSATLTEVVADFTFALAPGSPATQSVLRGKTATYQFTVAPTGSKTLAGDVSFTVTGLPTGATYIATPSVATTGSTSGAVTLSITTPATLRSRTERTPWQTGSGVVVTALLLLPFGARIRRGYNTLRQAGFLAVLLVGSAMLLTSTGCGTGVGYFDQSQSTYAITVTAQSGPLSHTASVTLEVQ